MKICCVSDIHRTEKLIPFDFSEADVLVIAGDYDWQYSSHVKDFNKWLKTIPIKTRICIAGNHDFYAQQPDNKVQKYLTEAIYLQSSGCEIDGIKFWGSPYTPRFGNWAFMLLYEELVKEWNKIPSDTNVLITHGPPYDILDKVPYGLEQSVGCTALRNKISELKELKLNVFGHIHCRYGQHKEDNVTYINASTCNEDYAPVNKPIVVEI